MIEGLINVMTPKLESQARERESNETMESIAIAGAAAIQRIIADRDNHRNRTEAQCRDLVALSAINEDLRRRIALIRHHYLELATKILTQLEQFDQATRSALQQDKQPGPAVMREDENLIALANRFKPGTVASKFTDAGKPRER